MILQLSPTEVNGRRVRRLELLFTAVILPSAAEICREDRLVEFQLGQVVELQPELALSSRTSATSWIHPTGSEGIHFLF